MQIHPLFYVSLLEPYNESCISGRTLPPLPLIEIDNEIEYKDEEILDLRIKNKRLNTIRKPCFF